MNTPGTITPPGEQKPLVAKVTETPTQENVPTSSEAPRTEQPPARVAEGEMVSNVPVQEEMKIAEVPAQAIQEQQVIQSPSAEAQPSPIITIDDVASDKPLDVQEAAKLQDQIG